MTAAQLDLFDRPTVVPCHTIGVQRFDLRVAGVTYLGAALHGNGGPLPRGTDPASLRRHQYGAETLVWTLWTARRWQSVPVATADVEVLRFWTREEMDAGEDECRALVARIAIEGRSEPDAPGARRRRAA